MRRLDSALAAWWWLAAAPLLAGCPAVIPVAPETEPGPDLLVELAPSPATVDLLFVVDNSCSMLEEQAVLAESFEALARQLVAPEPDASGRRPPAVRDLHVGVATNDIGVGDFTIMTCERPDEGRLLDDGRYEGCAPQYGATDCADGATCPWLTHSCARPDDGRDGADGPPFWDDFACIATRGTGGCGFEQPFEAALAALTTQAEPGGPNDGFLREGSLLAVVFVTDEDDCSAADPTFFDPARDDLAELNVRCIFDEDLLHPVSRYLEGLRALRPGREDLVVVAAIAGVPVDGSWSPGDPLDELRELRRLSPGSDSELEPSCSTSMGIAFPPVRIAELVDAFGDRGVLASVCRDDWSRAFAAVAGTIQQSLAGQCLDRDLAAFSTCGVVETLADGRLCPHGAEGWQRDLGLDVAGRRRCELLPLGAGEACPARACACEGCRDDPTGCACEDPEAGCPPGWLLAEAPACEGRELRLTAPDLVEPGSEVTLECWE